jgi:NAD(P)-dependent dehydrogenase (short-subunit alcohol dehydrogenase family)
MNDDTVWTLVTGGAKRLGAALCHELASCGHNIVIHYRNSKDEAASLAMELKDYGVQSEILQGDFSTQEACLDFIRRYVLRFPQTANLINNVGNYALLPIETTPTDLSYSLFQTNVHAPLMLMQGLISSIRKQKGAIINIGTSAIAQGRADVQSGVYMATKAALWSLTRSFAKECARSGATVNMVSPGQLDISISLPKDTAIFPMGRPGECQEVARVVAFLLKPENHYITAQNIEVSGALGL